MVTLFRRIRLGHHGSQRKSPVGYFVLAIAGYLLSPLSWWNDTVVNVPLAYVFSIPFTLISDRLFIPAFTVGYLLTNLAGFMLLHKGIAGAVSHKPVSWSFQRYVIVTLIYTSVILLLAWLGWIPAPAELLKK